MNLIILSRNPALYSTHSILVAGRKRGHNMRIVDHSRCDLVLENDEPMVLYENERISRASAVIPRIGMSATSTGYLVIRQFEIMNVFSVLSPDALLRTRDKFSCLQTLSQRNIPIPRSVVVHNPMTIPEILDRFKDYPVIIKLKSSTHGLGVMMAENRKTAMSIIETFIRMKEHIIVQEFIREARGSDVRIFVVNDSIVASMERQALPGEFRANFHRGANCVPVKITDQEALVARKAVHTLGLKVAGVDILRSNRGPLVLEVNASPGLEGIETVTGIDIASRIIRYVESEVREKWKYLRNY